MPSHQRLLSPAFFRSCAITQGAGIRHAPSARRIAGSLPCCAKAASYSRSFSTSQRWQEQADAKNVLQEGLSATKQAEHSMRRFWKTVSLARFSETAQGKEKAQKTSTDGPEDHLVVQLDSRSLKTPSGSPLTLPIDRPLLASMIAREWDESDRVLRPHALPLTSLAARALDGLSDPTTRQMVATDLLRFLETDTICFHETQPPVLVRLQKEHWDPILAWVKERFGVTIKIYDSIILSSQSQDPAAKEALGKHISTYDAWRLAAFERAVLTTKSFLVSLALVEGKLDVEQAASAAEVEVRSQVERWGEVEDTHDVDHHDLRRVLGSVALALVREKEEGVVKACL